MDKHQGWWKIAELATMAFIDGAVLLAGGDSETWMDQASFRLCETEY
jgi:outer membrane murein-binding lipoprotein Lpp